MSHYRYSEWDSSEDFLKLNADELMCELQQKLTSSESASEFIGEMRQDLLSHGDLSYYLRLMQRKGITDRNGKQLLGIEGLLQRLRQKRQDQLAELRSLLANLPPEDVAALNNLLQPELDEGVGDEQAKLAAELESLLRSDKLRKQASFSGEAPVSYTEAVEMMEMLQQMDKLEAQLKDAQDSYRSLNIVDEQLLKELMGEEAAEELERLRDMSRVLEEAGYVRLNGGRYELTPSGIRKIGQKTLDVVFAQLRKDRVGGHSLNLRGSGGERIDETKRYEFSDDFQIHLQRTLMNSLYREARTLPVRLKVEDFEVYRTAALARSATVLVVDLSASMSMRGNFDAAKQVAIALDSLIRSQYPNDSLQIIGFSSYARQIKKEDLSCMNWDRFDPYTNMQHALHLAAKLLAKEPCTNKQIIMISDGEPTAYLEDGNLSFDSPPTQRTVQLTLREVKNCTRKGIVINTFMLESGRFPGAFITQMARINKGRVFFTSANSLGQYLLVDYISNNRTLRRLGVT